MAFSLERWLGKVAIVTGANSGIGGAAAQKLAEEGIIVVGLDKKTDNIEENSKNLSNKNAKLYAVKADVTQEEEILNAFKWTEENVGPVSILINSAGIQFPSSMLSGTTDVWKAVLDVNLLGLCVTTREAIKAMRERNIDGHIINISSITAYNILPGLHMYPPSKFAVRATTETFRMELNAINSKIKIGCISPGVVDTPLITEFLNTGDGQIPITALLNTEDVANAIVYILSTPAHVQIQELIIKPVGEPF